jgi:hypothetical protein
MVHQPTHFNKYPAINDSKKYYDLIQNDMQFVPPNVQIIISKKEFDIVSQFEQYKDSVMFIHRKLLEKFDLDLCINVKQHMTKEFPKFAYVGAITY